MKDEIIQRFYRIAEKRPGFDKLIEHMDKHGFFESPCSTKFHNSWRGGLLDHSYKIYLLMSDMTKRLNIIVSDDTLFICSFLHDACKIGAYLTDGGGSYYWNSGQPKGHALLSIERAKLFVQLTEQEEAIIKYHMGIYGTKEFKLDTGEYTIAEMVEAYNREPLAKLFYFCDDMSSKWLER